jgi:hypothetical protein
MARHVDKLSAILVGQLKSPGYYGDGNGLWLQISGSGSKSWVFRFTISGNLREMGLGAVHTVSLSIAREKARQCRLLLTEGKDPIISRDASSTASALSAARVKTFDQCAAAYIKAHRGGWKSAKHAARGHLQNLLANPNKIAPVTNFPALPGKGSPRSCRNSLPAKESPRAPCSLRF